MVVILPSKLRSFIFGVTPPINKFKLQEEKSLSSCHLLQSTLILVQSYRALPQSLLSSFFTLLRSYYQHQSSIQRLTMAAIAFLLVVVLVHHASAQNLTTQILLPNALWYQAQFENQSFVGEVSTSGILTYYTIDCDYNNSNFDPGPVACLPSNSYTFSANYANTKYLLPE